MAVNAKPRNHEFSRTDYSEMALVRLRAIARQLGIAGRSKLGKAELAFAIVAERRLRGLPVGGDEGPVVDIAAITERPRPAGTDDAPEGVPVGDPSNEPIRGHSPSELVASAKAILVEYEPSALK
jgi:hypothetical protein